MGLTIHYNLATTLSDKDNVRSLVNGLRQYALDLPFQEVGEVVKCEGKDVSFEDQEDPNRWLKIQACGHVEEGQRCYSVAPWHIVAFATFPGEGSEPANFGFCRYPEFIVIPQSRRRLRTGLTGWLWRSFCKTQYASDPECGGIPNFLRCHLCVVKLLDFAKKTGLITVEVNDEGGYWDERNLEKLGKEVGDWNEMIAAFAGQLNDAGKTLGFTAVSAISGFQNFEHLEAKGLDRLKTLGLFRDS